ncbi:MAG TPA: prepilin-type N-terminal cleavage/methylation domain-containing protein [Candidatus Binatia bacterium]
MRHTTTGCASRRGFTLLEVVVAMAIVGLGVVTLLEIFSSGLQLGARSRDRTEAVAYGRQVMDQFLARRTVAEGTEQGQIGESSRWQLQVQPVRSVEGLTLGKDWELKDIALEIFVPESGRERRVELRTLRLVKKEDR